jgi:hypothetical protein
MPLTLWVDLVESSSAPRAVLVALEVDGKMTDINIDRLNSLLLWIWEVGAFFEDGLKQFR